MTHVYQTLPARVYYPQFYTHSPSIYYRKSFSSGKAASEEVPMEDNPAYGDVNIYDTVKEPKEN